jgi:dihydrodipicolinate synthase/N-acetylneuraminate lyase
MSLYTAVTTPFVNNKVDIKTLYNHILGLIRNKSGIILFNEISECETLSEVEKYQILDYFAENFLDEEKKSFIIAINGNTHECIAFAYETVKRGFTNIMLSNNKVETQEDLFLHYTTIASKHFEVCPESQIIINNTNDCFLTPSTIYGICNTCPNIVAVKQSSDNLDDSVEICKLVENIKIYLDDNSLKVPIMNINHVGLISVVSNVYTKEIYEIINLYSKYQFSQALNEYNKLHDFIKTVLINNSSAQIKYALLLKGIYKSDECRLHILTDEYKNKITMYIDQLAPKFKHHTNSPFVYMKN